MQVEYWFYTNRCLYVLLALSVLTATVAAADVARSKRRRFCFRPWRSFTTFVVACVALVIVAVYLNIPKVIDNALILRAAEAIDQRLRKKGLWSDGPYRGILTTPCGFPISWHCSRVNTVTMKVTYYVNVSLLRLGFNLFVLSVSLLAAMKLIKQLVPLTIAKLLVIQFLFAMLILFYLNARPSLRFPASIALIISLQVYYLYHHSFQWVRNVRVYRSARQSGL